MTPESWLQAETLVRGIYAIAYGRAKADGCADHVNGTLLRVASVTTCARRACSSRASLTIFRIVLTSLISAWRCRPPNSSALSVTGEESGLSRTMLTIFRCLAPASLIGTLQSLMPRADGPASGIVGAGAPHGSLCSRAPAPGPCQGGALQGMPATLLRIYLKMRQIRVNRQRSSMEHFSDG